MNDECCSERAATAPLPVDNRPALAALARRIGTHASVKAALLDALSRPDLPALAELRSRDDADFAVALLDGAAAAVDVLTFYVERAANEHYLRTASERRSLVELGRLVGYEVRPGLAATADLAFTLQAAPGAPAEVLLPAGTGVQSSPDPGGQPVVYETVEELRARPAFNALRPRSREPHPWRPDTTLTFAGTATNIRVGDGVIFRTGRVPEFGFAVVRSVKVVDAVPALPGRPAQPGRTEVELTVFEQNVMPPNGVGLPFWKFAPPPQTAFSWLAGRTVTAENLDAELTARGMSLDDVAGAFARPDYPPVQALVFRQQSPLFGSQAPVAASIVDAVLAEAAIRLNPPPYVRLWLKGNLKLLPWDTATVDTFSIAVAGTSGYVYLDGPHPEVTAYSQLVLCDDNVWGGYETISASVQSVAAQAITGRATRVSVGTSTGLNKFSVRRTVAYFQPDLLPLAEVPVTGPVPVGVIELDGLALGLRAGRRVVVTGEPVDDPGNVRVHATTLSTVVHDFGERVTRITLARFLPGPLVRSSVVIQANVAPGSHGQTRREPLGSGDATVPFQRFALRQPPAAPPAWPARWRCGWTGSGGVRCRRCSTPARRIGSTSSATPTG